MPIIPKSAIPGRTFSVAWNQAREVMRGHEPVQSAGMLTSHTPHGVIREPEQVIPYHNPAAPLSGVSAYIVVSHDNDTVIVSSGGPIAKPKELRYSEKSYAFGGVTITYTNYNLANQTRTADNGTTQVVEVTVRPYANGQIILAADIGAATGISGVTLQDLNIGAKHWAKKYV